MADLVDTATSAGSFNTLMSAIEAAGLVDLLRSSGSKTVLAPTDDAFKQLPDGTLDSLLNDLPKLKRILMYHIVSGDMRADDLAQIDEAPTEEGSVLAVEHSNGSVTINSAHILKTDILAENGVIHVIDRVLMPAILENQTL
ncbi:fasciclin domain-containing protein [Oculatella sp. LEGE 06141]|uniref:fasciclin domain-containing protein n=1 Tax=Oculatella sp. LEGE 06141 TaxID=1828648 RepID=UPI001882EFF4|nr:fasciclin domain-containing protein [Oculatella sp. LEGE 06141]MBE9177288.1 fasciclin domain-containing protein [Oculatella sp. LEGE 06141]